METGLCYSNGPQWSLKTDDGDDEYVIIPRFYIFLYSLNKVK